MNDKASKPKRSPIVEKLVSDPAQGPPNASVLRGYLGDATTESTTRLYLNPQLDEHVEIPNADVLHTHDQPDGSTLVWVPKSLQLQHVRVQANDIQAEFLAGPFNLPAGGPGLTGIVQQTPPVMWTRLIGCTAWYGCHSRAPLYCVSGHIGCLTPWVTEIEVQQTPPPPTAPPPTPDFGAGR